MEYGTEKYVINYLTYPISRNGNVIEAENLILIAGALNTIVSANSVY